MTEVLAMFAKNVKKAADVVIDAVQILASDTDFGYIDAHKVSLCIVPWRNSRRIHSY